MSRIGDRILDFPESVSIENEENVITVNGPKGNLSTKIDDKITVDVKENTVVLTIKNENNKPIQGTMNTLIFNMIIGVTEGYKKELEAHGVGYRFNINGKKLELAVGFSHKVEFLVPESLTVSSPKNTELIIEGIDKQVVGEFAANIRKVRPPEPYKGKGIRYVGEIVRRKEGKKAA